MSPDEDASDTTSGRLDTMRQEVQTRITELNQNVSSTIDEAAQFADKRTPDIGVLLSNLGQEAAQFLQTVIDVVDAQMQDSEFDIEFSGNQVHIEGDNDGLRRVEAALQKELENTDIQARVDYDRDEGLNVEFADSENGDS